MTYYYSLFQLGWGPFFQCQLSLDEWENYQFARVEAVERSTIFLLAVTGKHKLSVLSGMPALVVGDWVMLDSSGRFKRVLDRKSVFSRKAAGTQAVTQLIAANVDTAFVITSLNHDFNLNRIERYIALTREANADPVVVLTKADLCDNAEDYVQKLYQLDPLLTVIVINSLDADSVALLSPWCCEGKTVAFIGSSGVGKSTIINTLLGFTLQRTNGIREDDSKGRHTTTRRTLHLLPSGCLLVDTPGMRELQLAKCEQGIEEAFSDITRLMVRCKFSDCKHQSEPGCAVNLAIESRSLDERRLSNYRKLMREQKLNAATLAEKRAQDRQFGRLVRSVQASSRKSKGGS